MSEILFRGEAFTEEEFLEMMGRVALLDANAQVARIRRALCPRFYAMAAPAHVEGAAP